MYPRRTYGVPIWLGATGPRSPDHAPAHFEDASIGELKARHREDHLCFKCDHHMVCGMANALDPNLLVTIANCLGFDPAEDASTTCELLPIEALPTS